MNWIPIFVLAVPAMIHLVHSQVSEHQESDAMHFYYDPNTHYFIASTKTTCFMAPLTRDEQDHVHTTAGIEDLELTMMRDWLGKLAETKIYHDDASLPTNIHRWCSTKDIFLLERNITSTVASSTPASATTAFVTTTP